MMRRLAGLLDLVLGREAHLRLRMTRTLVAVGVYVVCVALQWASYALGFGELQSVRVLSFFCIVGPLAFAVAVRSGFAERFREPSLTMPQMVFAITMLAIGYHVHPYCRGTMPMIVALVLVYGAFVLSPRDCGLLGCFALVLFAATMAYGAATGPAVFDPRVEAFAFAFLALTVLPLCHLCGQLSRLRSRLQQQKQELRTMMEQLQRHAAQDHLTGLPNRRHVQQWMPGEIERLERSGGTLCLALLDLDRFKRVNDTFGHAAGDEVLRIFARETRSVLRAGALGRRGVPARTARHADAGGARADRAGPRPRRVARGVGGLSADPRDVLRGTDRAAAGADPRAGPAVGRLRALRGEGPGS